MITQDSVGVPSIDGLPPEQVVEALLLIRLEQIAKAREAYKTVGDIDRTIDRIVRSAEFKMPFRCEYGVVRKGYDSDRYRNPRKFRLLCRRTLVGPKKRVVVKAG